MMIRRSLQTVLCGVIGFAGLQLTPLGFLPLGYAGPEPKVTICHFPPGNPANVQTITVGASAVAAHVANHGDLIGACNNVCNCDDRNSCTADACVPAVGCVHTPKVGHGCCAQNADCDDGIECTLDTCDPATYTCENDPVDAACDDDSECTADECSSKGCKNTDLCEDEQICNPNIGCLSPGCNDPDGCCSDPESEGKRDRCLDLCKITPYTVECLSECNCQNGCTPPAPIECK
jgi:hypothetical protein